MNDYPYQAELIYPGMSAPVIVEVTGPVTEGDYRNMGFEWVYLPDETEGDKKVRVHSSRLTAIGS